MLAIKTYVTLIILVLSASLAFSQKKEIKVQILNEDKVVVDTMLYKTSDEAKIIIENLVQRFSREPVIIDTKLTHGLYVFNITNENWKEPDVIANDEPSIKPLIEEKEEVVATEPPINKVDAKPEKVAYEDVDIDSLFREFSKELDMHWNEAHIDIVVDSFGASFKHMWNDIKKIDLQNDPEIKMLKSDFQELFEKFKTTQFLIIQNGDTIKTY